MYRLSNILIVVCSSLSILHGQQPIPPAKSDSTLVFGTMQKSPSLQTPTNAFLNAWGIDLLVSTNGFGMGTFFRHEYSEDLSGYIDFSISEAKDDDEKEFIDIYGNTFTPGKVNRFLLIPLFVGLQQRLFRNDILDNFRPFVNGAVGPTMIYVFPYNEEYFTGLGKGHPRYTVGGYAGIGAYFGSERSNLLGLNMRYYFIPYPGGIQSLKNINKKQFGGFYISLSFGSAW